MKEWGVDDVMVVELSFMFIIILGRWLLPKGNISHSALSQLLLVYLSLASDILDLLTLFSEKEIYLSSPMVHIVLVIFSLCMFQFALNLTATRGRSFHAEFDEAEYEIRQLPPPIPIHQKVLNKLMPSTTPSSSTARPLTTTSANQTPRIKPRAASFSIMNPSVTIFENPIHNENLEMQEILKPTFPEVNLLSTIPRPIMQNRLSIGSLNSLHSSLWHTSRSKQMSRKSIAESVKVFVKKRSAKFLRSEIWSILVTLSLQDGPFFAVRLVAIFVYRVRSFLTYFFTFKNFLILLFQTYRITSICLERDQEEEEFEEKMDTIRRMSLAASQLGVSVNRNFYLRMKNQLTLLWRCIFGPKLYQTYPAIPPTPMRNDQQPAHIYEKNTAESLSDTVFFALKLSFGILKVTWPICLIYFYRKGFLTYDNGIVTLRLAGCVAIVSAYFMLLRGVGRYVNPSYKLFIDEFYRVKTNTSKDARQHLLAKFDFSLSHWQPDYVIDTSAVRKIPMISITKDELLNRTEPTLLERIFHYPTLFLGYICVNVFGRRLMFPGSLQLLRQMMERPLLDGRTNLIVQHRAKRYVIRTADGNNIDTIFVDRRQSNQTNNGRTLVVTCEGNAGFYEMGCMGTPIDRGYSVLGWNRPGFGESSGYPGALSEINSIDAVMRYAIEELHFLVDDIVIFAWSIGGYSACWTAVSYQDIRGLVLDAVFDDVLPLAQRQMPAFASKFVEKTIRYYLDLNNVQLLKLFNGPFYLIRRTQDEIISLVPGRVETNRGNELLFNVLHYRYPHIYNDDQTLTLLRRYVCANQVQRIALYDQYCSNETDLQALTREYRMEHPKAAYPCKFGETFSLIERQRFAVYLIDQYLVNFDSQHCTPLPQTFFRIPDRCV
ncbi:unnamed protein product [Adineta ricciae]|uniref:Uncharacterized protein n=1 Tax=Adineta ricciae TaxID=249248 RepID=A0A813YKR4_ADIRI|nr:unnamed protein product [Adineta ricciae]